jgi:hypothetical protein
MSLLKRLPAPWGDNLNSFCKKEKRKLGPTYFFLKIRNSSLALRSVKK